MKNQYFGDVNDYRKYSLLRLLSGYGKLSTAVCWMLTPDDLRPDGHRIQYLLEPEKWRKFDPAVFDLIHNQVIQHERRRVDSIQKDEFFPNCLFYSTIIKDDAERREKFVSNFLKLAKNSELVFFDPDNGIEIKSVPYGRKNSSKYVYYSEVQRTFKNGHSILIYQHLPPKPRVSLASSLGQKLAEATNTDRIYLYWTQFVLFFLIAQSPHVRHIEKANKNIARIWSEQVGIQLLNVPHKTKLEGQH